MRFNIDIGMCIAIFLGQLLLYPLARRRPPETRFLENVSFWRWILYSLALTGAILIIATPIRALMDGVAELFLILAIATFFIYKAARITMGSPQPANKVTPGQAVGVFAATMVYAWGTTAIVWNWPDRSPWILSTITVLFIAGIMLWAYRVSRKADRPD